jgi:hypothetical protein
VGNVNSFFFSRLRESVDLFHFNAPSAEQCLLPWVVNVSTVELTVLARHLRIFHLPRVLVDRPEVALSLNLFGGLMNR